MNDGLHPSVGLEREKAEALTRYRLDTLIAQSHRVNLPVMGLALFIGALSVSAVGVAWVVPWLLAVLGGLMLRSRGLVRLQQGPGVPDLRRALLFTMINGAVQGAPAWLFLPYLGPETRTVLTLILLGESTAAISASGFYLPSYRLYTWSLLVPLGGFWIWAGTGWGDAAPGTLEPRFLGLALFILLYGFVQEGFARRSQETFIESFDIRFRNEQLLRELRDERAALAVERDRAESASRAKSRFLAAASHDLRQPMHTMSLLGAALTLANLPQPARETAEKMEEAIGALSSLLDGLLDISKLDAGIVTVRLEPTALAPLLERLGSDFSLLAGERGVRMEVACAPGLAVETDRQLLERILRNLIGNAVKYTQKGVIRIDGSHHAGRVRVTVSDTGIGIPDEEKERVFEEFYQIDNPQRDRQQGLGLGLAIVQRLCKLLDIKIELRSELGRGTEIELELPVAGAHGTASATGTVHLKGAVAGLRVLLVDDEKAVRESTMLLLEALGCRVRCVDRMSEAKRCVAQDEFDIVIADYRLRDNENGVELIRVLRTARPGLAAILVSGDTAPERLREATSHGVRMLHKPVRRDALCVAIEGAVREAKS
jgi:signal transduction histidine kinase